jgi:hypothetical protein
MEQSAVVTEKAAVVYQRGCWLVSNISDVRIMWNITVFCEFIDRLQVRVWLLGLKVHARVSSSVNHEGLLSQ